MQNLQKHDWQGWRSISLSILDYIGDNTFIPSFWLQKITEQSILIASNPPPFIYWFYAAHQSTKSFHLRNTYLNEILRWHNHCGVHQEHAESWFFKKWVLDFGDRGSELAEVYILLMLWFSLIHQSTSTINEESTSTSSWYIKITGCVFGQYTELELTPVHWSRKKCHNLKFVKLRSFGVCNKLLWAFYQGL